GNPPLHDGANVRHDSGAISCRVAYLRGCLRTFLTERLRVRMLHVEQMKVSNAVSTSAHLNEVLELLRTLMEYRSSDVRQRLEKVGRAASMLHMDVLLLIYHFARFGEGNILEIGPYIGGSTVAAAYGVRESAGPKKIMTIEAGGRLKHFRLSSWNIIKDLKKNLARFGVAEEVTVLTGRSFDEAIIHHVRQRLSGENVGLFV